MTCLVHGFKTKKEFAATVVKGYVPHVEDPSIFRPWSGKVTEHPDFQKYGSLAVCLDHPKRSKFALIRRVGDSLRVE